MTEEFGVAGISVETDTLSLTATPIHAALTSLKAVWEGHILLGKSLRSEGVYLYDRSGAPVGELPAPLIASHDDYLAVDNSRGFSVYSVTS